jgi:hypothetical protein
VRRVGWRCFFGLVWLSLRLVFLVTALLSVYDYFYLVLYLVMQSRSSYTMRFCSIVRFSILLTANKICVLSSRRVAHALVSPGATAEEHKDASARGGDASVTRTCQPSHSTTYRKPFVQHSCVSGRVELRYFYRMLRRYRAQVYAPHLPRQ